MLNRQRLLVELQLLADSLFTKDSKNYDLIRQEWQRIANDPTFIYKVQEADAPWPVPTWSGKLDDAITVNQAPEQYRVLAVDGSQIYPDRHHSVSCFLINIGKVGIAYGGGARPVELESIPRVFTQAMHADELPISADFVNCRRQELEFLAGLEYAQHTQQHADQRPCILLFDGSFIFWHLEAKDTNLRELFLPRYLALLHQMYHNAVLTASYISLPKSRELVNLIRLSLGNFDMNQLELMAQTDGFVDATIAQLFLEPGQRTIVFKNNAAISRHYLDHVRPYFFYLHVGDEIARVEIPAYVAMQPASVDLIARILLDQARKGRGYPVALAESHEQAVVKGPDRDFFGMLLYKMGLDRKYKLAESFKAQRKRNIGI